MQSVKVTTGERLQAQGTLTYSAFIILIICEKHKNCPRTEVYLPSDNCRFCKQAHTDNIIIIVGQGEQVQYMNIYESDNETFYDVRTINLSSCSNSDIYVM